MVAKIRQTHVAACSIIWLICVGVAAAGDQLDPACREGLSKQAEMIYQKSIGKQTGDANLKELIKETARDLITENVLRREEATISAAAVLACLKSVH
jgi:hypothetical protein